MSSLFAKVPVCRYPELKGLKANILVKINELEILTCNPFRIGNRLPQKDEIFYEKRFHSAYIG